MASILSSDIIYATVKQYGRTIHTLQMSGVSSYGEVLERVRMAVSGAMGVTTIDVRNGSQGWCERRSVMLS